MFEGARAHARARSDRRQSRTQTALPRPRHYGGGVGGGNPGPGRPRPRRDLAGVAARRMCGRCSATSRSEGVPTEPTLVARQPRRKSVRPRARGPCPTAGTGGRGARPRAPAGARRRRRRWSCAGRCGSCREQASGRRCGPSGSKAGGSGRRSMPICRGRSPRPICARPCAYQRLDLRAGGPDLDELVQQIRDEIKDQWAVRYVEVETKSIAIRGLPRRPRRHAAGHPLHRRDRRRPHDQSRHSPAQPSRAPSRPTLSASRMSIGSVCPRCRSAPATARA